MLEQGIKMWYVCFHTFCFFYIGLIFSLISELKLGESCSFPLRLLSHVLSLNCIYLWLPCMLTHLCISMTRCAMEPSQPRTHGPCPNQRVPESRGRALALGPVQLATWSHDSNNWVASKLKGIAELFSPKKPDWWKMSNYGLRSNEWLLLCSLLSDVHV